MKDVRLKRLFLVALIASLCATAALAIVTLLFATFDDRTGRVLATTALIGGYSLLALPAGILLDQRRAVPLAWAVVGLSALGLVAAVVLVWEIVDTDSDAPWQSVGIVSVLAGACSQNAATTALRRERDSLAVTRLYGGSIVAGIVLAALACVAIALKVEDSDFYRILGAAAVVDGLLVLLQPFVRRLPAPPAGAETVHRFRCTLDRRPERLPAADRYRASVAGDAIVDCAVAGEDFAAAVAGAVRDLEATGARVVGVERDAVE